MPSRSTRSPISWASRLARVTTSVRMPMDFTGKHVVITGGSTGIGKATAIKIASVGGRVTLIARRAEVLQQAVREIGGSASCIAADVGVKAQIIAAVDEA